MSEALDKVPAVLRVIRTVRPKYGCRACEGAVVQAKAPARPVTGGMATTALIAHIVTAKYAWHLPLYRQVQILLGQGVVLDRATLAFWVRRAAWWLRPLYEKLLGHIRSQPCILCDETPLPRLDPGRGRTKIGQLWAQAVDDRPWRGPSPPAIGYVYAEGRRTVDISMQLASFSGVLQVDGYVAYKGLTKPGRNAGPIRLAFCLAHARRKFVDVHATTGSPVAREVIARIAEVYAIEAKIKGLSADERRTLRQARSKPVDGRAAAISDGDAVADIAEVAAGGGDPLHAPGTGRACACSSTTAGSLSTPTRWSAACGRSRWGAAILCSPAPRAAGKAGRPWPRSSTPPS